MAFWKKSDDPWDRKPEKRQVNWYENEAFSADTPPAGADVPIGPEAAGAEGDRPGEETERLGDSLRKLFGKEEEAPPTPEKCPWCGRDMEWGYLTGGRDGVSWRNWKPKGLLGLSRPEGWKELDLLDEGEWISYKTVWLCGDCGKMVLTAPASAYTKDNPKVDWKAYSGGDTVAADPQAYEKYQEQWGKKEE